jgi:hypothetical protein
VRLCLSLSLSLSGIVHSTLAPTQILLIFPPFFLFFFLIEDGKEMVLDGEILGIKGIIEEVDRHSRALQKQADLTDG